MNAKEAIDSYNEQLGLDDDALITLLARFIDGKGLALEFEGFLFRISKQEQGDSA